MEKILKNTEDGDVIVETGPLDHLDENSSDAISVKLNAEKNKGKDNNLVCEECLRVKQMGVDGSFHLCVNDKVIIGFRSSAGPIDRPKKKSNEGVSKENE
ncbi:hypothetical protein RIF29_05318 [Crotalaria pallida]|uniref:Uncharacterized protein n=1 Tax=Crotalaria pallida TaxID=3830 RepID=A0AAN9J1X1_CROPI